VGIAAVSNRHINAVDIVTRWELVAAVEHISEAFLLPVIALLLEGFPFAVLGFHSDSGSEYINYNNEAAKQVPQARWLLFQSINRRSKTAA
jgi:hypothetical protein